MSPAQLILARRRLCLGITNVGFWVVSAAFGLYWLVSTEYRRLDFGSLALLLAGVVAAQAVFDFIGGVVWMPGSPPSPLTFLRGWLRGMLGHTLVLVVVGCVGLLSLRFTGGFSAGILLATLALAFGRRHLLSALGGVVVRDAVREGEAMLTAAVRDPAFTGGIVGFGRRAKILLPAGWIDTVPGAELAAESSRRRWQIANGLPGRTLMLILIWNILGAFAGSTTLHLADRTPAAALLGHACWMTLWAFASLLVLPVLSRQAVFAADRAAADSGPGLRAWIKRFPDVVGEDGSSNAAVQTVFYPVPSAGMRLHQLGQSGAGVVWGNLARTNLYYSWATLTLLGRAVHCNVGRPVLWVYPPSA